MRNYYKIFIHLIFISLVFTSLSCTKSSSSDDSSGLSSLSDGSGNVERGLTDCGTVVDNNLENPVQLDRDSLYSTRIIGENMATINVAGEDFLVKLHGIKSNGSGQEAVSFLNSLASGDAYFVEAVEDCTARVGDGVAFVGQLFTPGGRSYSEALLKEGLADADSSDPCGVRQILSCYEALEEDATIANQDFDFDDDFEDDFDFVDNSFTGAGSGSAFLWKPVSEGDGKLVILIRPFGATVFVNGERLRNTGPSNGRGTTARASRPGCGYGRDAKVTARGANGEALTFPNGKKTVTIANGCNRVELG